MPTEKQDRCDNELIDAIVMGGVIDKEASDRLIRHLDACDRCRDRWTGCRQSPIERRASYSGSSRLMKSRH